MANHPNRSKSNRVQHAWFDFADGANAVAYAKAECARTGRSTLLAVQPDGINVFGAGSNYFHDGITDRFSLAPDGSVLHHRTTT